jgi:hypothetical protein
VKPVATSGYEAPRFRRSTPAQAECSLTLLRLDTVTPYKFPITLTNELQSAKIEGVLPESGPVAQLGARFHGMEEVIGSIPIRSTNKPNNLADSQKKRDTLSIRWFSCCILRSTFYDIP